MENTFKYSAELVLNLESELLEGPVFDKKNKLLYFVSILDCRVFRYNPLSRQLDKIQLGTPCSCVFITIDHGPLVSANNGFFALDFDSLAATKVFEIAIPFNTRFNDGALDANGRILIGTMGYPEVIDNIGSVLSYDKGVVKVLIKGTTISNGIVFTKDSKNMFFIDTPARAIARYTYDLDSGSCEYVKDIVHFRDVGLPDGMDIDDDGNLWVAEWGGSCVSIWNSLTGEKEGRIEIPSENVTSVCFDDHKNLYVTTARSKAYGEDKGGAVFYVKIRRDA